MKLLIWMVVMLGFAGRCAFAQSCIEIRTELDWTSVWEGSGKSRSTVVSAVCVIGNNEWWIDQDFLRNGRVIWHYDGTNVYQTTRVVGALPEELQQTIARQTRLVIVPPDQAKSNITIRVWPSEKSHPLADAPANLLWLAFCSGSYLRQEGRLMPLPIGELRHTRDRFAHRDETEVMPESGLPRRIEMYLARDLFLASQDAFDREHFMGDRYTDWVRVTAQALPDRAHMFHYQVAAWTNFLGRILPADFEFWQAARNYEQNGNWAYKGVGRITGLRSVQKPPGLFESGKQQTIVDYRFRNETKGLDALIYTSTNDFLLPTSDKRLKEKFDLGAKRVASLEGSNKPEL